MPRKKNAEELAAEAVEVPMREGASESVESSETWFPDEAKQTEDAGIIFETKDVGETIPMQTEEEMPDILAVLPDGETTSETVEEGDAEDSENVTPYGEDAVDSIGNEDDAVKSSAKRSLTRKRAATPKSETDTKAVVEETPPTDSPQAQNAESDRRAFYGLDFNELDRELTPEQRQEWNSIYASYRGRSVMTGTIVGIDRHRLRVRDRKTGEMASHRLYCAIVIPFRVSILIPETEMWLQGEERPGFVLRNIPGATIDFVIIHVDREAGFAIGSRRLALPSRKYFFSTQPGLCTPGSRVNCEVLVVGPRRCLVTCHGHDIDLTQRELSYTAVPDLRDVYHSGQTLDCIVKAYDRSDGRLSISVKETAPNPYDGAEFRHPVHSHRQAVIAGKYGGGVFCNMADGVTVMCNYSFHYDDSAFRIGDRVMLIIQKYDDSKKQIYGKIVAKC